MDGAGWVEIVNVGTYSRINFRAVHRLTAFDEKRTRSPRQSSPQSAPYSQQQFLSGSQKGTSDHSNENLLLLVNAT